MNKQINSIKIENQWFYDMIKDYNCTNMEICGTIPFKALSVNGYIDATKKFIIPQLTIYLKENIREYRFLDLEKVLNSKNEYLIEYYDYSIKKTVKHKMYCQDSKISKIMTFIGTLND